MSEKPPIRIMFVGDMNLGEYYTSFGHGPRTYLKNNSVFEAVTTIFNKADFVAGNLEAALSSVNHNPCEPESTVLRGDPKHAILLRKAGFKVLQIANNHTIQHGKESFDETVQALSSAGITPVGIKDQEVQIIHIKGQSIGFLAASDVPDNTEKSQISYQTLSTDFVIRAKESVKRVDHLFVMLHWGLEASTEPMEYQRKLTTELIKSGVRGVIGSHPHLFYEIWQEQNGIAAPSLGNFVFDLCWDKRLLKSGILDVSLRNRDLYWKVWPITITNDGSVPLPTSPAISPTSNQLKLYELGNSMSGEQIRKLYYFFRNMHKGNLSLKLKFIIRKFLPFLKPSKNAL